MLKNVFLNSIALYSPIIYYLRVFNPAALALWGNDF